MAIDAKTVAQLREMTGAGMMDAKKALEASNGDLTAAAEFLKKNGQAKAEKKGDRVTKEGRVYSYIHSSGKIGALVEIFCETDFVAKNDGFTDLLKDVAMHIAAADPLYVRRDQVPPEVVEKQRAMFKEEVQGKPADIVEKIVDGKLNKYFAEVCLMEQPFVKDDEKTVEQLLKEKIATIGENMQIGRFARFMIG